MIFIDKMVASIFKLVLFTLISGNDRCSNFIKKIETESPVGSNNNLKKTLKNIVLFRIKTTLTINDLSTEILNSDLNFRSLFGRSIKPF